MGGGKIKDATALPSDVAKGKVFYNNDGRQEGTNEPLKAYKYVIDTSKYPNKSSTEIYGSTIKTYLYTEERYISSQVVSAVNNSYTILLGATKIISVAVNGVKFNVCSSKDLQQSFCILKSTESLSYSTEIMLNKSGDILLYSGQYAPKRIIEIEYLK